MARLSPDAHEPAAAESPPDALLLAVALMIWTYVWRLQDLVAVLGAFKVNLLATALAIGLLAIDRHPARALGQLKSPILAFALALVAIAILGIPTSLWPRNSGTAVAKELVPNLLLMVMLAASIRGLRDLEWIATATLLGACVYSLFALLRFGVDASGRFGDLVYYDANDLALVLLCTIPIGIHLLVRGGWRHRLLGAGSLMLLGLTFATTGSRGGFLALVAVLLFVLFGYRVISRTLRILAVVGGFGLFAVVADEAYWDKIRTLGELEQDYNWSGQAPEGRMEVWRRGVRYMADNPVVGVGLRSFPIAEGMLSEESRARAERGRGFKWSVAHNSFLEVGAELGVTGLVILAALLVSSLRPLRTIRRGLGTPDPARSGAVALACALTASFIGFIVAGMFVSAAYFSFFYVLLGLSLGLIKVHRLEHPQPSEPAGLPGPAERAPVPLPESGPRAFGGRDRRLPRRPREHAPFRHRSPGR